jgi:hypothetical protein
MSHTPGPWEIHDVAEVDEEWEEHHDFRWGILNHAETAFIAQALDETDARLIAAAPTLLAVVEDVCVASTASRNDPDGAESFIRALSEIGPRACAAIAKARSE